MRSTLRRRADGFRPETLAGIDAVEEALALARQRDGAANVTVKDGRDLVTATDVAVEDAVRAALGGVVIGEERGGDAPTDGSSYWLVDPICGTRNFASGIPLYSVNLALVERGEVTVAVVGDASTGEIVVAERGRGAWTLADGGQHRLRTRDDNRTIVIEAGKSHGARRERAAQFAAAAIRADRWDIRSLGTTLSATYVATGRVAAYVVFVVPALHTAAGSLLITEAGGVVSDIDGGPFTIGSDSLVGAANRQLHDELRALMS